MVILPMKLAEQAEQFEKLNIPCLVVDPETLDGFWTTVELLGEATGTQERAEELIQYQRGIMESVATRCAETEERPSVYIAGSDFLRTAGSGMFQNELIEMCGGVNAAAELTDASWTDISPEQLIGWDPERIYMVSYAEYTRDDVLNDTRFASLQALRAEETNFLVFPSAIEPWDYPTASMAFGRVVAGASAASGYDSRRRICKRGPELLPYLFRH